MQEWRFFLGFQTRNLLRIAVFNISYIRGLFPEKYFDDKYVPALGKSSLQHHYKIYSQSLCTEKDVIVCANLLQRWRLKGWCLLTESRRGLLTGWNKVGIRFMCKFLRAVCVTRIWVLPQVSMTRWKRSTWRLWCLLSVNRKAPRSWKNTRVGLQQRSLMFSLLTLSLSRSGT